VFCLEGFGGSEAWDAVKRRWVGCDAGRICVGGGGEVEGRRGAACVKISEGVRGSREMRASSGWCGKGEVEGRTLPGRAARSRLRRAAGVVAGDSEGGVP